MHSKAEYLDSVIPYRMKAIDTFRIALRYVLVWHEPKPMEMYFDGRLCVRGLSTAWTNPVVESGIMHCRACLEFLGLRECSGQGLKLAVRNRKRADDYGVEDYDLPLLTIDQALAPYAGTKEEAERALASVIHCANKGVAHMTANQLVVEDDLRLYEIAARGVPALLANHLYIPLGRPVPDYKIAGEPSNGFA